MIETDSRPDVFDDAVHATAYMATAMLKRGELMLPQRIREHLADGPVIVHLMRGEHDVAVHEATLTSRSTLTGIEWPDDVKPRTSLTVLCPRGGAGHDIGVLLPELEPTVTFLGAVPDENDEEPPVMVHGRPDAWTAEEALIGEQPVAEPVCTCTPEWCYVGDDVPDTALASECRRCAWLAPADGCPAREEAEEAALLAEPETWSGASDEAWKPVTDEQLAAITGALTALADATPVAESTLPGPADYTVPTAPARTDEPTEQLDAVEPTEPKWPGEEDSEERTDLLPVVVAPVRSPEPPRRKPGWLERRVRLAARWVLDRSWTATRILIATASGLILAGAGLAYLVLAVTR